VGNEGLIDEFFEWLSRSEGRRWYNEEQIANELLVVEKNESSSMRAVPQKTYFAVLRNGLYIRVTVTGDEKDRNLHVRADVGHVLDTLSVHVLNR